MMRNNRSGKALVLALALCISLLSGCSQPQTKESSESSTSQGSVSDNIITESSGFEVKENASVSFLGPEGTYTEEAAKFFFQNTQNFIPKKTVDEAISEVISGNADYAVIPQENTLGGAVTNYIDALIRETEVYVVGEVIIPILPS